MRRPVKKIPLLKPFNEEPPESRAAKIARLERELEECECRHSGERESFLQPRATDNGGPRRS